MAAIPELKERVRRLFYPAYEARMVKALPKDRIPQHIGVMLDGNRRWAKGVGGDSTHGYRAGAANIEPLLEWSEEVGVQVVTLWLLSTDNLNRPPEQLEGLLGVIGDAVERSPSRAAGGSTRSARSTCCRPRWPTGSRRPRSRPATSTGSWSTSPCRTAAGARSRTPYARCSRSTPSAAPAWRSWPR